MSFRSAVLAAFLVLSACTGAAPATQGPSAVPALGSASPTPAAATATTGGPTPAPFDLSTIDACALLDEPAVQQLTGTTADFRTDAAPPFPSSISCFWGAPGAPQYVEIRMFKGADLDGYQFKVNDTVCTTEPITDAGIVAVGGTCSTPQQKVYVLVAQDGVVLSLVVNEPTNALAPTELLAQAKTLIEGVLAG